MLGANFRGKTKKIAAIRQADRAFIATILIIVLGPLDSLMLHCTILALFFYVCHLFLGIRA
ncbi:MAG: hypothetical protein CMM28_06475 [Rhodospirillaceae bacterium]|nr:hypothetical protein [Rhodospirillaceae bacterium]